MSEFVKILRDLIAPIILLIAAISLRPYFNIDEFQSPYIQKLPLILLAIAMILSFKFNRQFSVYLLMMTFALFVSQTLFIEQLAQLDLFQINLVSVAFAIFIPLNLIVFSIWRAPKYLSLGKLGHLTVLAIEIGGSFWLIQNQAIPTTAYLSMSFLPAGMIIPDHMSHFSILLFLIAFVFQGVKVSLKQDTVDSALLVSIVALFISTYYSNLTSMQLLIFCAIGIMITIAIIQESFNMAFIDPLTHLPSRRAMNEELNKLGKHYSIAMLDIDHFKKINDTYGHDVGDQVLRKLAKHLKQLTGGGHVSRYGGEEFAVIYSGKSITEVTQHLEILRENIANSRFSVRKKPRPKKIPNNRSKTANHENIKVTVSIGVAERNRAHRSAEDVQKAADIALYKAKKNGRNKVCY